MAADRVLLCHRAPERRWYPDVWDLPGGHVDDGEDVGVALARELDEELGIVVAPPADAEAVVLTSADMHLLVWPVRRWLGTVRNAAPDEHDGLRWVAAGELPGLALAHPGYVDLLTRWLAAASG